MITWEIVRHQVAIAGRVTDAQTGRAIARALVSILAAPAEFTNWLALRRLEHGDRWLALVERPDRTLTVEDGHFHFLDLPDGQYTLEASLPGSGTRFGTAQAQAIVARDAQGKIAMAAADIALPPTTLKGRITSQIQNQNKPVVMAQVRVKGSGESAFTDSDGCYLLAGLEAGNRTLLVSATEYQTLAPQTVLLSATRAEQTQDFTLVPSST